MKKAISVLFFLAVFSVSAFAQTMQASIGAGSSGTRIKLYIRPTSSLSAGNISTFQFDVAVAASVTPAPAINFVGTPAFGSGWVIQPSYIEDGYRHYEIVSALGGPMTLGAGVEFEVMELEFSGGPVTANDVTLITLPAGGNTGNALWLCTGAANSVEGQLYYTRPGTTVVNNTSYTGALPSTATISGVLLPVNWLSFNAAKQNNNAILNWEVANESANKYYELQRSTNGTSFTAIGTVNNTGLGVYSFTDASINTLAASIIYYRIKQVDVNGRISYSDIRQLRLNSTDAEITIFPNPVKEGFYVTVPGLKAGKIRLNLTANDGKTIAVRELNTLQATNYYFDVKRHTLAAGQYNLQILHDGKILSNKKLYINQ